LEAVDARNNLLVGLILAGVFAFFFSYWMVEDLIRDWLDRRRQENVRNLDKKDFSWRLLKGGEKMPNGYHKPQKNEHADAGIAREIIGGLNWRQVNAEPLTDDQYAQLEPFDWDIDEHLGEASVKLHSQDVDILHVVTLASKEKHYSAEVIYRAKLLLECPKNLLEDLEHRDDPFSISFKAKKKGLFGLGGVVGLVWGSDDGTQLEHSLADVLNEDMALQNTLMSSGYTNVNAWLQEDSYMAINTSKSYAQAQEIVEFLNIANIVAKRLKGFSP